MIMASDQPAVSEYFKKKDEVSNNTRSEKDNPNKRTRSELSSTGSSTGADFGENINQRILDELV